MFRGPAAEGQADRRGLTESYCRWCRRETLGDDALRLCSPVRAGSLAFDRCGLLVGGAWCRGAAVRLSCRSAVARCVPRLFAATGSRRTTCSVLLCCLRTLVSRRCPDSRSVLAAGARVCLLAGGVAGLFAGSRLAETLRAEYACRLSAAALAVSPCSVRRAVACVVVAAAARCRTLRPV